MMLATLLLACSSKQPAPPAPSCNGYCPVQLDACDAASVPVAGGGCTKVGVVDCAEGFTHDDANATCEPILPAMPCGRGTFAVPGESECHEVAPCGADRYPAAPDGAAGVLYVDAMADDATADGSMAKPYAKLATAYAHATDGAALLLAAGTYTGDLRITRPLQIVGVCPAKVEIQGVSTSGAALDVRGVAVTVRSVAITGAYLGVSATDADALLDAVWLHDTKSVAINVDDQSTTTGKLRLHRSLVESVAYAGAADFGADLTVEESSLRDVKLSGGQGGPGVLAQFDKNRVPNVVVRRSVVERTREAGIGGSGAALDVAGSVVRDVEPMADGTAGNGILASYRKATGTPGSLVLDSTLVSNAREMGVAVTGATAKISRLVVRDTRPRPDGRYGAGLQADPSSSLELSNSVFERNHHFGVAVFGAEAHVAGIIVRGTMATTTSGGTGLAAGDADGKSATVDVSTSRFDGNTYVGVIVSGATVHLAGCAIEGTAAGAEGKYGDGVVAIGSPNAPTSLDVRELRIARNARAGLSVFGVQATIARTLFECNAFDLDTETYMSPAELTDVGENACGCGTFDTCRAESNALEPLPAPTRLGG